MDKKELSIILPTYNERDNIIRIIELINSELEGICYQIIVVDDNSPDGTGYAVKQSFENNPNIEVFIREGERGLATAILYGIRKAIGDKILVMDTDFNHDPNIIPIMLKKSNDYDLVIGSRFVKGGGMEDRKRYYYSLIFNKFIQIIINSKIRDNLCGYFLTSREIIQGLNLDKIFYGYGDYFMRLVFYLQKLNCSFIEIPVFYKLRSYGESKSRFLDMLYSYTVAAVRLKRENYA